MAARGQAVAGLGRLDAARAGPRRLILGLVLPEIEAIYADRLRTWREWATVSRNAFGTRMG